MIRFPVLKAGFLLVIVACSTAVAQATSRPAKPRTVVDEKTEVVIRGCLKWLAAQQGRDGSWTTGVGQEHRVAMTGYAMMAFLASGQLPDEGEHGKTVAAATDFLLGRVGPDGFIEEGRSNMYGHGIAAIALAEVYGQTRDPRIRPKLASAIKLIEQCQNKEGGWRYAPRQGDADISVTVLQVVALRAAKNSGLDVPQAVIDRAVEYVHKCHDPRSGGFCYQPNSRDAGFARTAAALYSLQVCGKYDDPRIARGVDYLVQHWDDKRYFAYGHFYAAPAMYMVGGSKWDDWYVRMRKTLLAGVTPVGRDQYVFSNKQFDGMNVGPVYNTSVFTMVLAMPWQYLPLYQR